MADLTNLLARLPALFRQLHAAEGLHAMTARVREELSEALGLTNAWLYLRMPLSDGLTIAAMSGPMTERVHRHFGTIPIHGDPMIEALVRGEGPIVIPDVQVLLEGVNTDITTNLGNRTLINAPIVGADEALGILGSGTFGDEGPIELPEGVETYYAGVSAAASAAVARIRHREEAAEREAVRAKLARHQRLESLGRLAGGVAHDLNNLLMVVQASAWMLDRAALDDDARDEVATIRAAVDSAGQLTRQLLALGRKQALESTRVDVGELVDDTWRLIQRLMPPDITIEHVPGARELYVLGDPRSLEQVIVNLALNARDAMPDGGRLTIETELVVVNGEYTRDHPWARPGRYVLISASDTGHGMDAATRGRIFEPFFSTKGEEGSGLGLAVAYGIVEQHHGMLQCYSEVGVGTTFKVYLPVYERSAALIGTKLEGAVPGGTERVLIADDDRTVRRQLRRVFEGAGYQVTTVTDGVEAVENCTSQTFDLVVLDAVMPNLDGRGAFEQIRAACPDLPVLFVSGYSANAWPAAMLRDLGVRTLAKPANPDTLLRVAREVIDGASG